MGRNLVILIALLLGTMTASADEQGIGQLTGAWIPTKIGPISGGLIYAFNVNAGPPPQRDLPLRGPDAVAITDDEGKFSLDLAEGTYFLSTRKQSQGGAPGPPQEGDLYGLIRDERGELIRFTVQRGISVDIGILRQATVFKSRPIKVSKGMTGIAGVVRAVDGSPLENAIVLVYDSPDFQRKPNYISHKTGKNGKYTVKVNQEGTYFMTVRAVDGRGRPQNGDVYGVYGGEMPQPVRVINKRVTKGIDIQAGQFVDYRPQ